MGERVRLATWFAMLVSAFGVYVMVVGGSYLGNFLGFAIAMFYGGAVVVTRYRHTVQMLPAACLAAALATIVSFTVLRLEGRAPIPVDAGDLVVLFGFGAVQLAGGMLLFTYGARLISSAETALLSILESVAAPVWVFLVFNEDPGLHAILGGAIVLGAVVVYTSLDLGRRRAAA